jgi:hypothetical protein
MYDLMTCFFNVFNLLFDSQLLWQNYKAKGSPSWFPTLFQLNRPKYLLEGVREIVFPNLSISSH